jgi:hypothetical protein
MTWLGEDSRGIRGQKQAIPLFLCILCARIPSQPGEVPRYAPPVYE